MQKKIDIFSGDKKSKFSNNKFYFIKQKKVNSGHHLYQKEIFKNHLSCLQDSCENLK